MPFLKPALETKCTTVNIFVNEVYGVKSMLFEEIDVSRAKQIIESEKEAVFVLDVRNPDEFWGETGHIEGATLIPIGELQDRLKELEAHKNKTFVVFCYAGPRSRAACEILERSGYQKLYNVLGGMMDWCDYNFPTVEKDRWPDVQ